MLIDSCTPKKKTKIDLESVNSESLNTSTDHVKEKKQKVNEGVHSLKNSKDNNVLSYPSSPVKWKKIKESPSNEDIESLSILFGVNSAQKETMEPMVNLDSSVDSSGSRKKQKRLNLEPLYTDLLVSPTNSLHLEDKNSFSEYLNDRDWVQTNEVEDSPRVKPKLNFESDMYFETIAQDVRRKKKEHSQDLDSSSSSSIENTTDVNVSNKRLKGPKAPDVGRKEEEHSQDLDSSSSSSIENTTDVNVSSKISKGHKSPDMWRKNKKGKERKKEGKKSNSQELDSSSSSDVDDKSHVRKSRGPKFAYVSKFLSTNNLKQKQTKLTDWLNKQQELSKIDLSKENGANKSKVQIISTEEEEDSEDCIEEANDSKSKNKKKPSDNEYSKGLKNLKCRRSKEVYTAIYSDTQDSAASEMEDSSSEDEYDKENSGRKQGSISDRINASELSQLAELEIQLPRNNIPPLHQMARPSKLTDAETELAKKAKKGRFSKAEDEVLTKNWESFCESHNLTIRPSALFRLPRVMSIPEKIKFLQYLSTGLDDRNSHRIYQRFKALFREKVKLGR
uniref:Uncharacterized protein PF11_0213-like n=1 Tax=Diabrotica virgifera virgifera TaxID=50390 RepID=A0A6P7HEG3_DIAVI